MLSAFRLGAAGINICGRGLRAPKTSHNIIDGLARTGPPLRIASRAASAGEVLPEAGQTAGGKPV